MTARRPHAPLSADHLRVELGDRSYDIVVGESLLTTVGHRVSRLLRPSQAILVTDATVERLHLKPVRDSLNAAGVVCRVVVLPPGEPTKDFFHLQRICDRALEARIDRETVLVALGGGVVGDIAGFAAGILLRGLPFVQIPTTLLAQVDSSVGGKTGINASWGKNLIGLFHQPRLVLADIDALSTLDGRQLRAGYAEVVKYSLINNADFFGWLESHGQAVLQGDRSAQRRAVLTSCAAKAAIVAADEREASLRALLNLGHTFGHALEAEISYSDALLHGEAVAIGMTMAFDLSVRLELCPSEDAVRVRRHLEAVGLPIEVPALPGQRWSADALLGHMARDKKVRRGSLTFVLARGIGKAFVARDVAIDHVRRLLQDAVGDQRERILSR